jgi:hypothetical protein
VGWDGRGGISEYVIGEGEMSSTQLVVVDGAEFVVELADGEGPRTIADDDGRSAMSFDGVSATVRAIGSQLAQAWETVQPDEASVAFGLRLTAKTGKLTGLLVDGGGEATLSVTMTWKNPS